MCEPTAEEKVIHVRPSIHFAGNTPVRAFIEIDGTNGQGAMVLEYAHRDTLSMNAAARRLAQHFNADTPRTTTIIAHITEEKFHDADFCFHKILPLGV